MKYHVLVGQEHLEVDLDPQGGGFRVLLDGEEHHVEVAMLAEGRAYSLLIDGRSIDVGVEQREHKVDLLISGHRYGTEVLGEREWIARSIQGDSLEGDKTVRAAMTGIVRDVLVGPGDEVSVGQTLFILEAMKMENEVKAEVAGAVASVAVRSGDTVTLGDVVVEIE